MSDDPLDLVSLRLAESGDLQGALALLDPEIEDTSATDEYRQEMLSHRAIIYRMFRRWTDEATDLVRALQMPCGSNVQRFYFMVALGENARRRGDNLARRHWYSKALAVALIDRTIEGRFRAGREFVDAVEPSELTADERATCCALIAEGWGEFQPSGPPPLDDLHRAFALLMGYEERAVRAKAGGSESV
jgi:hypothetical protein